MRHENIVNAGLWDLVDAAPGNLEPIADCLIWASNEDYERGTCWLAFLDLIGWSDEHIGQNVNAPGYRPGHVEMHKLAKALTCYSERPSDAWNFVCEIEDAHQ